MNFPGRILLPCAALAVAFAGCASDQSRTGGIDATLTLDADATIKHITTVAVTIDCDGIDPITGLPWPSETFDVNVNTSEGNDPTDPKDSLGVFKKEGLPEGNCTVTITAVSDDGTMQCGGQMAEILVTAGPTNTFVTIVINCITDARYGGIGVGGEFNQCAEYSQIIVSPTTQSTGGDPVDVQVWCYDPDGGIDSPEVTVLFITAASSVDPNPANWVNCGSNPAYQYPPTPAPCPHQDPPTVVGSESTDIDLFCAIDDDRSGDPGTPCVVIVSVSDDGFASGGADPFGCSGQDDNASAVIPVFCQDPSGRLACASYNPLRDPFFGDTHIHTNLSLDANLNGTRPGPDEAYAFARGGFEIGLQPYDQNGNPSRTAELTRPLDFVMLSDHAEFLGTVSVCQDPSSDQYDHPDCVSFRDDPNSAFIQLNAALSHPPQSAHYPALCGAGGQACIDAGMEVWGSVQDAAEAAYDRTEACEFTSFVGYEWSASPGTRNLHRNIIFKNENVPATAVGYFDAPYVEQLWDALYTDCINAGINCEAFSIPHNSNLSAGTYFEDKRCNGDPFNEDYVAARNAMEPIIEVYQHKGASECLPGEPIPDELCGFEALPFNTLGGANQEVFVAPNPTDFVRSAFGEGMKLEESLGANPFKHGMIAATDTHISAPGLVEEAEYKGHGGAGLSNRDVFPEAFPDINYNSPGGLAGVWAEENSRESLFEAMQRKETFATSGPRIVPRFFGGWNLPANLCNDPNFVAVGYAQGVPMGGDMFEAPPGATPKFIVSARQDAQAAPLQRIQIVKGWLEGGAYQVEVHEVAGDPNNGASVDLNTCNPQGVGFSELCEVWEDPDFDPSQRAYYYARIVENPTCRWTTLQCVQAGYDCNGSRPIDVECCDPTNGLNLAQCAAIDCNDPGNVAEACCLPRVEPAIQERAWTSPIWYSPTAPTTGPVDTSGIAGACISQGSNFQQEARYELVCTLDTSALGPVPVPIAITVKASVEPGGVLTQDVESAVTHSVDMSAPLLETLASLAPGAQITVATAGLAISNASPAGANNQHESTPTNVTANFSLNTVDTLTTADGNGPVTLDLVAFEISMDGLVTPQGAELVPGGAVTITEASVECTAIALGPGEQAVSFGVLPP
ncbi:MAG: DUF3604 domain-containing protein [Deltaproteobacteria bacterium]|nr:DUF3604 domain-containing protein [Deltaproteobacteria bacterium]